MKSQVVLLFPFDLGLELDFSGQATQAIVHEVSVHPLPAINFKGKLWFTKVPKGEFFVLLQPSKG